MYNDFLSYLLNLSMDDINEDDKNYISSFYKKKNYIDTINDMAISVFKGEVLHSGIGNYNSNIVIIIDDYKNFNYIKAFSEPVFNYINISLWNTYITFHKKTNVINADDIYNEMLYREMSAINPKIILYFSDKETLFEEEFNINSSTIKTYHVNIEDVKYVLDKNHFKDETYVSFMEKVYQFMIKLIPYKEIEILE